uniref:Uncharacterized protein n=1 Tax=Rhizophora mucronata TaxID=61149 RepID=A0A2P2PE66_RHIMU
MSQNTCRTEKNDVPKSQHYWFEKRNHGGIL